jgi:hypothetical protein
MHPEIYRELISQRSQEMRAQAHRANLAKRVRWLRRTDQAGTAPAGTPGGFVLPAVPDYVDGTFAAGPQGDLAASQPGQVPAARHAA